MIIMHFPCEIKTIETVEMWSFNSSNTLVQRRSLRLRSEAMNKLISYLQFYFQ